MMHDDITAGSLSLTRRGAGLSLLSLLLAGCSKETAANYPNQNISFIIPYGAGGGFDAITRVIAPTFERALSDTHHVIPVNVPAGGGGKGISQLYRAAPDGYTIGIINIPGAFILQERQRAASFDLNKFTWLGKIGRTDHYALAVPANSPYRTVEDLQRASQKTPIKFTSTGPDGTGYAATLIATQILGIRSQIIAGYKGSSDYMVAAIRGDGDAVIASTSNVIPMATGNFIRILATFEAKSTIPDVPDAAALGKPELADITVERLIAGPPGMPADIVAVLSAALNKTADDPKTRELSAKLYAPLAHDTPENAAAIVRRQSEMFQKWKKYL